MGSLAWNHGTCSCILFSNRNRCVVLFHLSWLIWFHCHSWCRLEDPGAEASHRRGDPCWCAALGATPGGQSRGALRPKAQRPRRQAGRESANSGCGEPQDMTTCWSGDEFDRIFYWHEHQNDSWPMVHWKRMIILWVNEWHNTSIRDSFIIWDEKKYQWPITLPPCVFLNRKLLETSPGRSWSKPSGPKLMMIQVFFPRFFSRQKPEQKPEQNQEQKHPPP